MMFRALLTIVFTLIFVCGTLLSNALACFPAPESATWTLPASGDLIGSNTPILVGFQGGQSQSRSLRLTREGEEISADWGIRYQIATFANAVELLPAQPLVDGDYELEITYDNESGGPGLQHSFSVEGEILPRELSAPSYQWYRHSYDEPWDSCYYGLQRQHLTIEPVGDAYFYVIEFERSGNTARFMRRASEVDGRTHIFEVDEVECIRLRVIDHSGTAVEAAERCLPDRCVHQDAEVDDWHDILPCDGSQDPGAEGEGEAEAGDGDGEADAEGEVGDEDPDAEQRALNDGCCATADASSPLATILLLLLGLSLLRRTTRQN